MNHHYNLKLINFVNSIFLCEQNYNLLLFITNCLIFFFIDSLFLTPIDIKLLLHHM
ncbi:hypothetical protein THIOM_001797 [Candidatus Thiomargarita nelsonii]|uniref:Uncharacterized protein n=1 Tax=Candidatus Thiomargarita nelsonii TaxID=1003181 RepID=A0A176S301_9GAMM|nr:hypothetical protein THIOM_001797 [Candidatus Thiomargarita nelsonii]